MPNTRLETDRLLAWLGELLKHQEAVDVDVVIMNKPPHGSSLQITVHDVPSPLAGLTLREARPE